MSHTYDMQDMSIHTRECRQFMYCSGNISHGVPFLLYTTYTCNHYRSAGARRHHCEEDNSEEKKWMHRGSDSYQEGNEISLQISHPQMASDQICHVVATDVYSPGRCYFLLSTPIRIWKIRLDLLWTSEVVTVCPRSGHSSHTLHNSWLIFWTRCGIQP